MGREREIYSQFLRGEEISEILTGVSSWRCAIFQVAGRHWLLGVPPHIIAVHIVVERESLVLCLETNTAKKKIKMRKKKSDFIFIQSGRLLRTYSRIYIP